MGFFMNMNDFKYVLINIICFCMMGFGSIMSMDLLRSSQDDLGRVFEGCNKQQVEAKAAEYAIQGYTQIATIMNPGNPLRAIQDIRTALDFINSKNPGEGTAIKCQIVTFVVRQELAEQQKLAVQKYPKNLLQQIRERGTE
jgi:hypothetical protein